MLKLVLLIANVILTSTVLYLVYNISMGKPVDPSKLTDGIQEKLTGESNPPDVGNANSELKASSFLGNGLKVKLM